jgi:4-hydroxybenzoate polyprenyltransferase
MHLFSAIPDIKCDKDAGIRTTAVVLGKEVSLVVCGLLWLVCAGLVVQFSFGFLGMVYPVLAFMLVLTGFDVSRVYWWFPWVNSVLGFVVFVVVVRG